MRLVLGNAAVLFCIVLLFAGCGNFNRASAGEADSLRAALAQVKGAYAWRDDLNRYLYSEKLRLEEILSGRPPEKAVSGLVDCLDDTSPSQSVIEGRPVPVGIICYEALTQLVYHEPTTAQGDIAATWPGELSPRSSPQQMREAKNAWMRVVDQKLYVFQ